MKFNLISCIGVAIFGVVIGFLLINAIMPALQDFPIKTIQASADGGYNYATYDAPNAEVFNYDALNPTVEVYIGECESYDANGNCREITTDVNTDGANSENSENSDDTDSSEDLEEYTEDTEIVDDSDVNATGQENE